MESNYSVLDLKWKNKKDFLEIMSSAFKHDPVFHYFFNESAKTDKQREKWMNLFFTFMWYRSLLGTDYLLGLFIESRLCACAIIETNSIFIKKIQNGLAILLSLPVLYCIPMNVVKRMNTYMLKSRENFSQPYSQYLAMIGVSPNHQGKGIGKSILKHIIDSNKNNPGAIGIALDTENSLNITIYNKLGFKLLDEIEVDHLKIYRMYYSYEQCK